jgi:membrane-anchored protein YejM (alkaline phosphatase superfamily)
MIDWVRSFRMGDLYTYLTFIGIISLWCFLGLVVIVMVSS